MDVVQTSIGIIVILIILVGIGASIVFQSSEASSSTTYAQTLNATANTSTALSHEITTVNFVNRLFSNSSTNSTPILIAPGNHTLLLSSPGLVQSEIIVIHEPNIASSNLGVYVNSNLIGTLGNSPNETFNYSGVLTSSTLVEYR